jgi:hypothetical protein
VARPHATPPIASTPMAMLPIAMIPFATRGRMVIGSMPPQTWTSGQSPIRTDDAYS